MGYGRWYAPYYGTSPAARLISGVGALFALIEIIYVLLRVFGASAENAFVEFIRTLAQPLALFFPGLFQIDSPRLEVVVDYGLAAVFWLLLAGLLVRVIGR